MIKFAIHKTIKTCNLISVNESNWFNAVVEKAL